MTTPPNRSSYDIFECIKRDLRQLDDNHQGEIKHLNRLHQEKFEKIKTLEGTIINDKKVMIELTKREELRLAEIEKLQLDLKEANQAIRHLQSEVFMLREGTIPHYTYQ